MSEQTQLTAFITGVTSGLGKALAEQYLAAGWTVFGVGRKRQALDELCTKYEKFAPIELDVTDKDSCSAAISAIAVDFRLVILNAGSCEYVSLERFDATAVSRMMDTNVNSLAYCVEALLPKLKAGSQLAVMSSSVSYLPIARAEAYGASKAAADYFTRALSIGLQSKGVDTSLIQPGFVQTPLTAKNEFSMPFLMSAEAAAERIVQGLRKRQSNICFPKRLIWCLKLLNSLPLKFSHALLNR